MRMLLLKIFTIVSLVTLVFTGSITSLVFSVVLASLWALEKYNVTYLFHKPCTYKFSQNY